MATVEAQGTGGQALIARGRELVMAMPARRRTMLGVSLLLILAVGAGVSWWGSRTEWKVLYANLEARDLQQVQQELAGGGIAYETTPDGSGVQVPAELVDKARMEIATKGTPQSGRMGFELFDKPNWVGSEFDEKVNYQRAMEGELEHTISTPSAVRSARVHLVLPKDSMFASEKEAAKASVVLKLKRAAIPAEQVESIRNLVAGAVENLSPEQVTLVDADGRADLRAPSGPGFAGDRNAERAMEDKLVAMLEPLAGHENVRATVNIAYDMSTKEKTDEVVDPAQAVALSTQKHDEISGTTQRPGGVPGTSSNTPGPAAAGSVQATLQVYPGSSAGPQSSHEESSTFAVTRRTVHEETGAGTIRRVSAAVLINDRELHEGEGRTEHTVWKARSADEMKRLEQLARAAVGFDDKRGDEVVLQNVGFTANQPEPEVVGMQQAMDQAGTLLRSQPGMLRATIGGLVVALLIMTVVRPVVKQSMSMLSEPMLLPSGGRAVFGLPQGGGVTSESDGTNPTTASLPEPAAAEAYQQPPRVRRRPLAPMIDDDGVKEYVTEHIRRSPDHSRRLLEGWIAAKETPR